MISCTDEFTFGNKIRCSGQPREVGNLGNFHARS